MKNDAHNVVEAPATEQYDLEVWASHSSMNLRLGELTMVRYFDREGLHRLQNCFFVL